ncbi:MAG: diguanylate cyclase [Bacteroidales bacterium]
MKKAAKRIDMGDLVLSVATFLVLALLVQFGVSTERARVAQNLRTHVSHQALIHIGRLETELNANVFLANGVVAHIVAHGGKPDGTILAALQALHQYGRHIRNIGIAPGNRISHVYPLEGNQAAIGLYYPDVPAQWPAVRRAIENRAAVLAGPVALRQGGTSLISRTPVFMPDGHYWGLVSLALDTDSLFEAVGLRQQEGDIRYALRGKDGKGSAGEVFLGDAELFTRDAIVFDMAVPGGSWQLAAMPTTGWTPPDDYTAVLNIAGLAAALAMAAIVHATLRNRRRIADSEQRLRAFLDTTKDAVIVIDDHGMVQEFNPAAEKMFGYGATEMLGASLNVLMPTEDSGLHDSYIQSPRARQSRAMTSGRQVNGCRKDGSLFPVEVTVGEARVAGKRLHVGVVRDITERRAFEQKLVEAATQDSLTGALNRRAFMEAAHAAITLARRHDRPLALLMLDADHFKSVNDTYGHHMGDAVLMRLSALARACVRGSDCFGRLGGEEFAILLPETTGERAAEVAERLLAAVRAAEVATDDGKTISFTISIGLAALTPDIADEDALLRHADRALYCAKSLGRDRWYPAEDNR